MQVHDVIPRLLALLALLVLTLPAQAQVINPGGGGGGSGSSFVQGPDAPGSVPTGNPLQNGGIVAGPQNLNSPLVYPTVGVVEPGKIGQHGNVRVEQANWTGTGTLNMASFAATFAATGNTISGLTAATFTAGSYVVFTGSPPTGVLINTPYIIITSSSTVATIGKVATPTVPVTFGAGSATGWQALVYSVPESMATGQLSGLESALDTGALGVKFSTDGITFNPLYLFSEIAASPIVASLPIGSVYPYGNQAFAPLTASKYVEIDGSPGGTQVGDTASITFTESAASNVVLLGNSLPNGTQHIGSVNVDNANANGQATMANSSPVVPASDWTNTLSPLTQYHHYSATTAGGDTQNIKATPGTLYSLTFFNTTTTPAEIKFYDLAAAPTCSSATGVVGNFMIPANSSAPGGHFPWAGGLTFATGISFCIVAQGAPPADTDATATVAGIVVNAGYR
jgi:hypothetical protein